MGSTTVSWTEGSVGFARGDFSGLLRLYMGWAPVAEIMAALALLHPEFRQYDSQQALYERVLLAPLAVRLKPPVGYTRRLAMALVKEYARENVELFEPLLELAQARRSRSAKHDMGHRVYQFASRRCRPDRISAVSVVLHCADEALAPDDVSIATSVWPAGRWLAQVHIFSPILSFYSHFSHILVCPHFCATVLRLAAPPHPRAACKYTTGNPPAACRCFVHRR